MYLLLHQECPPCHSVHWALVLSEEIEIKKIRLIHYMSKMEFKYRLEFQYNYLRPACLESASNVVRYLVHARSCSRIDRQCSCRVFLIIELLNSPVAWMSCYTNIYCKMFTHSTYAFVHEFNWFLLYCYNLWFFCTCWHFVYELCYICLYLYF